MHGSYRRNFGPESVDELRNNISSTHEEFLKEDDPDKKADALRYMTAYAMQFLYLVPHDKKFLFKETERVLHHSSMNISDFDPREGSVAFEFLARYAHNLLDQPWRTDFHTIKLTSGFFVHNISSQLHNAHEILVAMGYVHTDETTLKLVPNVDNKRLKAVSRDMIIASQECLVLSQIWQRVADQEQDYPLTIGEVFEFRRKYLGDTDTICKTLLSDIRRRNHEANLHNSIKSNQKFVPVEKLIEYEGMESDGVDGRKPEKEVEIVEHVLRNTRILHQPEDEHIYDPVYNGPVSNGRGLPEYSHSQHSHPYPPSYSSTNEASAFAPNRKPSSSQQHYNSDLSYGSKGRDSVSPMIPKTVSNFHSNQRHSYNNHTISNSSSMSSISGKASRNSYSANQPLKFSKVPPEEEIRGHQERRDKSNKMNWSDFSSDRCINDTRRLGYEKPEAVGESSRSRKPIMPGPGDVYPDDYFPRVVKPTPIHSSTQNHHYRAPQPPNRYMDESEEDVMHEALAYASEIKGLTPNRSHNEYGMRPEPKLPTIPLGNNKGGWETDSRSFSSENSRLSSERDAEKRSASSAEASSWGGTVQQQALDHEIDYSGTLKESDCVVPLERNVHPRPSKIGFPSTGTSSYATYDQQRFSESSPESLNEPVDNRQQNDYREQYKGVAYNTLSSSSSPSPKSPLKSPTSIPLPIGEQLQSIDVVYYDTLLKKNNRREPEESIDPSVPYKMHNSIKSRSEYSKGGSSSRATKSLGPPALESSSLERNQRLSENSSSSNGIKTTKIKAEVDDMESNYNLVNDRGKPLLDKRVEKDTRKSPMKSEVPVKIDPWNCRFCTYKNTKSDRICEICSKSKDFYEEPVEEEEVNGVGYAMPKLYSQPLPPPTVIPPETRTPPRSAIKSEIQCPQCTLLNYSNKNVCEACNFRLRPRDSPELV